MHICVCLKTTSEQCEIERNPFLEPAPWFILTSQMGEKLRFELSPLIFCSGDNLLVIIHGGKWFEIRLMYTEAVTLG